MRLSRGWFSGSLVSVRGMSGPRRRRRGPGAAEARARPERPRRQRAGPATVVDNFVDKHLRLCQIKQNSTHSSFGGKSDLILP